MLVKRGKAAPESRRRHHNRPAEREPRGSIRRTSTARIRRAGSAGGEPKSQEGNGLR
jgi:hypothetical protein